MSRKLKTITRKGNRLEQLKALAIILAEQLDKVDLLEQPNTAQLAKQYRDTIYEISELEAMNDTDDELSNIMQSDAADGFAGADRPKGSGLS